MERPPNHPHLTDTPSINIPMKVGGGSRDFSNGTDCYNGSTDVSLFSTSLPVLGHEKLNLLEAMCSVKSVPKSSRSNRNDKNLKGKIALDDLDAHGTGGFLPDDEDDLLAGIAHNFDFYGLHSQLEDLEDDDVFCSGGGLEFDSTENLSAAMGRNTINEGYIANGAHQYNLLNGVGSVGGEHPLGEHPSRTLFVRNINSNVEDAELHSLFEQYGDIRTLYTACKHRGFVMISYYDIRDARTAMRALQNKPLRRRKLDIHFSIPKDNPSDKDINQGTLVVFNLEPSVSNDDLRQIFGPYGEVKEIRETPHKRHHKFIEFYDVRAAEAALRALNRSDIAGKRIKLEPSRPGGARRNLIQQLSQELEHDEPRSFRHNVVSPIASSPPGLWASFGSPGDNSHLQARCPILGASNSLGNNNLPGLASVLPSLSNSVRIPPIGKDPSRIGYLDQALNNANTIQGHSFLLSHPFAENNTELSSYVSSSPGTASITQSTSGTSLIGTLSGPHFLWGSSNTYSERTTPSAWPVSSLEQSFSSKGQGQRLPYFNRDNSFTTASKGYHGHYIGSAPSAIPLERHLGFFRESSETSFMNPVALGAGFNQNDGGLTMNTTTRSSIDPAVDLSGHMLESGSLGFRMRAQYINHMIPGGPSYSDLGSTGLEGLIEHGRNRRLENAASQVNPKKQYQLALDKIIKGEDSRTTVMIKNIPNKYTSKMLLVAIDESHRGTYDFLYLPIDFKNKCNVGYAFINMVSASHVLSFYQAFNGKKWEKFNSEKVASLAYARIQGKAALVSHFQNSSLMTEDKWCRPILFRSEGVEAGDQEPFPLSSNINVQLYQQDGPIPGSWTNNSVEKDRLLPDEVAVVSCSYDSLMHR